MSSEPENPPGEDDAPAADGEKNIEENVKEETVVEENVKEETVVEENVVEETVVEENVKEEPVAEKHVEVVLPGEKKKLEEEQPEVAETEMPKVVEAPAPEQLPEVKKRESISFDSKKRESKAEMTFKESLKSLPSLGKRASKDSDKGYFDRRKSQRSIRGAVGSVISFRKGSIAEYYDRQRAAKFMNTYKLDSDKPFNVDRVTKILEEVLVEALDNLTYDAEKVPKQAKWASSAIRAKVKEQEYDRYKILCIVTIGEKRSQDVYSMYRFLWDAERDKHASFVHENMSVYAIAMCFGLYYE